MAGGRRGLQAIMYHAPDIAEDKVVIGGECGEVGEQIDHRHVIPERERAAARAMASNADAWKSRRRRGDLARLQRLGAHRARLREQEALAETYIVIQKA